MPVNDQILSTDHDYIGAESKPLCSTRVAVTGGSSSHGRASGQARSADGTLSLELRMPDELGGDNLGPNPEQLFAAGYAACFHGVLSLPAGRHLLDPATISVEATVAFGRDPADGGYRLRADRGLGQPDRLRAADRQARRRRRHQQAGRPRTRGRLSQLKGLPCLS